MPPAIDPKDLITVTELSLIFGGERRYHTGVIHGLGLGTFPAPKNAIAIHRRDFQRYKKRMAEVGRVPAVNSSSP
jgi:hypothetical protein